MAVSKVILNGQTLMNVTSVTADAEDIAKSKTAMIANGTIATGTKDNTIIEEPLKDVVFIDYEGTIIQQYTKTEFLALESLPANPSHPGLTAQGWNWSLSDAKTYVTNYGTLCIGQNYITNDGKTRIYYTLLEKYLDFPLAINFTTSIANGAIIDWGDGSSMQTTAAANANGSYTHAYSEPGEYIITIESTGGDIGLGYNGVNLSLFGSTNNNIKAAYGVTKIEVGNHVTTIYRQCFSGAWNMEKLSLPVGLTNISTADSPMIGGSNSKIKGLVIPNTCTSIGKLLNSTSEIKFVSFPNSFHTLLAGTLIETARNLRMFTLPEMTTSHGMLYKADRVEKFSYPGTYTILYDQSFRDCTFFHGSLTIPSTVTEIKDYACNGTCPKKIHLLPTTPPTLVNSRALNVNSSISKIYVPYSADHSILDAYKTATNWSSFASYMEEEPQ